MSTRIRKVLSTGLVLLSIFAFMLFASQPVYAGQRDFTNTEKELVEEAIKFLQDNGTDDIGGKSASAELTSLLNKKAADGLNHIRRDTEKGLGDAAASTNGTISVGLPTEANINKDINTAEGFTQVKTLAQTLYHEWVHYRRFQQYGKFLIPALDQNWAKCQPLWDEVEAYYLEIKQKLSWKLARENELAGIPGYGPIQGPPTPAQQARAEQLQREIADLEKQIDEAAGTTYLAAKRKVSPGSALRKSYEEGGTLIKDAFAGMNSNQAKHTEVTSRLNDISLFYAGATAQSIESRINEKVTAYQSKVTFLTLLLINWLTGGTLDIHFESYFMRLIIVPLGLYETDPEEIEIEGFVVESEYMLPWQDLGCHILSPVYQVGTSLEVMANSDHPSTVTLSFNAEELEEGEEPHIYALRTESSGRSTADSSEASWAPLLVDEEIDLAAKTITAKCSDPFTLFVVMVEPSLGSDANLSALEVDPGILDPGFDPSITNYTVDLASDIESITVTATLADLNASLNISGEEVASNSPKEVDLNPAGTVTTIPINITAEDGEIEKTYTITVNREEDEDPASPVWSELTPATARVLALDGSKLAASFDGLGVWIYDEEWTNITSATAAVLAYQNGVLAASFDGFGVWLYDGEWTKITSASANALAFDNHKLAASFDGLGVWIYDEEWTNITSATAAVLAYQNGVLAASFDGFGVWLYDGEWTNSTPASANALAFDNHKLATSFEGLGVWIFNEEWTNITPATAGILAYHNAVLAATFGDLGIWIYDEEWTEIASANALALAYKNDILAASFEGFGVWLYQ